MRHYRADTGIDCANPVNWTYPLVNSITVWYCYIPGLAGGAKWPNLVDARPNMAGTLTSLTGSNGWRGGGRPGGWGWMRFPGGITGGVYVDSNLAFPITLTSYTWAHWVNGDFVPGSTERIATSIPSGDPIGFVWGHGNASFRQAASHRNSAGTYFTAKIASISLAAQTWYHVMGTWDGSNLRMYLNGLLEATTATTATIHSYSANLSIGIGGSAGTSGFPGGMDDNAFWANRCLGSSECRQWYLSSRAGHPAILHRIRMPQVVPPSAVVGGSSIFQGGIFRSRIVGGVA